MKTLTRKEITEHEKMSQYLRIPAAIESVLDGRICGRLRLPFLALIADLVREQNPERFHYLEIGVASGGSMIAVGCHMRRSRIEKYAGIDIFDPSLADRIERTDRNIRYFAGPKQFALFEGRSDDEATARRATAFLKDRIDLLYIDGDHSQIGVLNDWNAYSPLVADSGVVIFDDYHDNEIPGVTSAVSEIDFAGWNVVGALDDCGHPTMFVVQKCGE